MDRDAIIRAAFFGLGTAICRLSIPKETLAYDPTLDYHPAGRKTMHARGMHKILHDATCICLLCRDQGEAYKKGAEGLRVLLGLLVFCSGCELEATTLTR